MDEVRAYDRLADRARDLLCGVDRLNELAWEYYEVMGRYKWFLEPSIRRELMADAQRLHEKRDLIYKEIEA
ncbi:hypothetical protein FM038_013170 [Shewanella eurypsychrophilus]|uniref:Uncharacterized protein n=1 Tax=Shewanella eurypsychrophilus TaxID=2593656 RepID=A0ABX6VCU4_9GAMM|nr:MULTISPECIES: hypothetical protein [Shewanella]QFU23006.1 hypothetical protein FS418_14755 [Shewanella sp. YLB-09]QPG58292.1 hypothetical protein FM038_013170 [Shewanella eurypsychrophilus]